MINIANGLGQNYMGLMFYKFSLMPKKSIIPPIGGGGGRSRTLGYENDEEEKKFYKHFHFRTEFRELFNEKEFTIEFPIKKIKIINITLNETKLFQPFTVEFDNEK